MIFIYLKPVLTYKLSPKSIICPDQTLSHSHSSLCCALWIFPVTSHVHSRNDGGILMTLMELLISCHDRNLHYHPSMHVFLRNVTINSRLKCEIIHLESMYHKWVVMWWKRNSSIGMMFWLMVQLQWSNMNANFSFHKIKVTKFLDMLLFFISSNA